MKHGTKKLLSFLAMSAFLFSFFCSSAGGILDVKAGAMVNTMPSISTDSVNPATDGADVTVDPAVTITSGSTLNYAYVYFSEGYIKGEDELQFTDTANISGNFDTYTGILTLSGTAAAAEYQTALRSVTYHNNLTGANIDNGLRTIVISLTNDIQYFSGTGHYYEYVSAPNTTWLDAENAAASMSLYGRQGYLAAITTQEEDEFLTSITQGDAWIGATDATDSSTTSGLDTTGCGEWYWRTGPEAGTFLCSQNGFWGSSDASAQGGMLSEPNIPGVTNAYTNFNLGEPNDNNGSKLGYDFSQENCLVKYTSGAWNDGAYDSSVSGYLVEFGGMPSDTPSDATYFVTKTLTVNNPDAVLFQGSGTKSDPYQVANAEQLALLASRVNRDTNPNDYTGKYFIQTADIDLTGMEWTPIGNDNSSLLQFNGSFDGQGHTVTNMSITSDDWDIGLFGYLGSNATVKNLTVEANMVSASGGYAGVIAGESYGTISDCHSSGLLNISGDWCYFGGLVGENDGMIQNCSSSAVNTSVIENEVGGLVGDNSGTIQNSFATGSVASTGESYIGGLVGNSYGEISNCYATGSVTGGDSCSYIGGLVGENDESVTNCYATGSVSCGDLCFSVGGLIGANDGPAANCYAAGSVAGGDTAEVGGFAGYNNDQILNCYATGSVTGRDSGEIGGLVGENHDTVTNGYWNTDAAQTVGGTAVDTKLGVGTDSGNIVTITGMALADMKTAAFASTLTANASTDSTYIPWAQATGKNAGLPYLQGIGDVPDLDASVSAGNTLLTTKINVTPETGDTLAYVLSSSAAATPNAGDSLAGDAPDAVSYPSGSDIGNVTAGQVLALYEVDSNGNIVKFKSIPLTADCIRTEATETGSNITFDLSGITPPSGVASLTMSVTELPAENGAYASVEQLVGSGFTLDGCHIFDLKLLDQNGAPVTHFDGAVTVKIPVPEGMSGDLHVYWYDDSTGALTDMNATLQDNFLIFETNHFSYYAVAQLSAVTSSENPSSTVSDNTSSDDTSSSTNSDNTSSDGTSSDGASSDASASGNLGTGSSNLPILPIAALGVCSMAALIVVARKKKAAR